MSQKPDLLLPGSFDDASLASFKKKHRIWVESDIYDGQLKELYEISHPGQDESGLADFVAQKGSGELSGAWVYYPWSGVLLHTVGPDDLQALRTNRNQHLISSQEQQALADATVAVAGMSVGAGIAYGCAMSGISNNIKIADFDDLETANLNRLAQSLSNIGKQKSDLAAQKIYELNPFAEVQQFARITDENIDAFFENTAVVIDEIDDFKIKVALRVTAKAKKVPLLMFTSLGDNILVDVERYDQDPNLAIFNGAIGDVADEIMQKENLSPDDIKRYAVQVVGPQFVPTKALQSVMDIGRSLVGRPQLYSTIAVDGGLAAYMVRSLLLGAPLKSGRYFIKFAELFGMPAEDLADSPQRQVIFDKMRGL